MISSKDFLAELHSLSYTTKLKEHAKTKEPIILSYPLYNEEIIKNDLSSLKNAGLLVAYVYVTGGGQASPLTSSIKLVELPRFTEIQGIQVLAVDDLTKAEKEGIKTVYHHAAGTWLPYSDHFAKYGMDMIMYQGLKEQNTYQKNLQLIEANIARIIHIYNELADTRSKSVYLNVIRGMVSGSFTHYDYDDEPQYLLPEYAPRAGDIAIDGGAYDGMSALDFLEVGAAKVYSFELDSENYQRAKQNPNISTNPNIILENKGLGSRKEHLPYISKLMSSHIGDESSGYGYAELIDLDTYASEQNIGKIHFIKLDVEGAEKVAIEGMRNIIVKDKPRLAICTYHKAADIFELPELIKSIRPDYELAFRHYRVDGRNGYLSPLAYQILDKLKLPYMVKASNEHILYCK